MINHKGPSIPLIDLILIVKEINKLARRLGQ